MRPIALSAAALFALGGSAAVGDVIYLDQARSVSVVAGAPSAQSQSESAPGFGEWAGDLTLTVDLVDPPGAQSTGRAAQISTLAAWGFGMTGEVGGSDGYPYVGIGSGFGQSRLEVTFRVDQPTPFSLGGTVAGDLSDATSHRVVLSSGDQTLFAWAMESDSFEHAGILTPGEYWLEADFGNGWLGASTGSAYSTYEVAFSVPSPGGAALAAAVAGFGALRRRHARR